MSDDGANPACTKKDTQNERERRRFIIIVSPAALGARAVSVPWAVFVSRTPDNVTEAMHTTVIVHTCASDPRGTDRGSMSDPRSVGASRGIKARARCMPLEQSACLLEPRAPNGDFSPQPACCAQPRVIRALHPHAKRGTAARGFTRSHFGSRPMRASAGTTWGRVGRPNRED